MSSSETPPDNLTELQHRHRARSLASHHASRAHHDTDSVVLTGSEMILVSDAGGDAPAARAGSQGLGLFHRDTRFLSVYELTLNGTRLVPLSSHEGGGAWSFHVLGNPELAAAGAAGIAPLTIAVRRERAVAEGALHEIISLTNFGTAPARLSLELAFAADFVDIFVVRGIADPPAPAPRSAELEGTREVRLRSRARDGIQQLTRLRFSPPATGLTGERAVRSRSRGGRAARARDRDCAASRRGRRGQRHRRARCP